MFESSLFQEIPCPDPSCARGAVCHYNHHHYDDPSKIINNFHHLLLDFLNERNLLNNNNNNNNISDNDNNNIHHGTSSITRRQHKNGDQVVEPSLKRARLQHTHNTEGDRGSYHHTHYEEDIGEHDGYDDYDIEEKDDLTQNEVYLHTPYVPMPVPKRSKLTEANTKAETKPKKDNTLPSAPPKKLKRKAAEESLPSVTTQVKPVSSFSPSTSPSAPPIPQSKKIPSKQPTSNSDKMLNKNKKSKVEAKNTKDISKSIANSPDHKNNNNNKPASLEPKIIQVNSIAKEAEKKADNNQPPKNTSLISMGVGLVNNQKNVNNVDTVNNENRTINGGPIFLGVLTADEYPVIKFEFRPKVPRQIRQSHLDRFLEFFLAKFSKDKKRAIEEAVKEEQDLINNAQSKNVYINLFAQKFKVLMLELK